MTNYEWLKSLDIQQLAKWLSDNAYDSDELPPEDYIVWLNNEYDGIETEPGCYNLPKCTCGTGAIIFLDPKRYQDNYAIKCPNCGLSLGFDKDGYPARADYFQLIRDWNKLIAEIKQAKHLTTDYISEKLELYNQDESDFYTDLNDIRKRVEGLNDWSERKW